MKDACANLTFRHYTLGSVALRSNFRQEEARSLNDLSGIIVENR